MKNWLNTDHYYGDPKLNTDKWISDQVRRALEGKKEGRRMRGGAWQGHVGYTIKELYAHVESLFEPGMSWDNFGEWHLDHVIPKHYFRYGKMADEQFKACWSLANLHPMWAHKNIKKGIKPPPDYVDKISALSFLTHQHRKEIIKRIEAKKGASEQDHLLEFAWTVQLLAEDLGIRLLSLKAAFGDGSLHKSFSSDWAKEG